MEAEEKLQEAKAMGGMRCKATALVESVGGKTEGGKGAWEGGRRDSWKTAERKKNVQQRLEDEQDRSGACSAWSRDRQIDINIKPDRQIE